MNQFVSRILILSLGLFVLSCSRSAGSGPTGGGTPGNSSGTPCSVGASCADSNEMCDLLVIDSTIGSGGTCRKKCDSKIGCGNSNEVCNPISGACEVSCASEPSSFCQTKLPSGGASAVCISGGYCALASTGTCPSGLKESNGFCKFNCSGPGATTCSTGQICDAITNTCEAQCSNTLSCPSNLPQISGTPSYACSPNTATCVASCSGTTCPGTTRSSCYVASGSAGTCEKGCKIPETSGECGTSSALGCHRIAASQGVCGLLCPSGVCAYDYFNNQNCSGGFCGL